MNFRSSSQEQFTVKFPRQFDSNQTVYEERAQSAAGQSRNLSPFIQYQKFLQMKSQDNNAISMRDHQSTFENSLMNKYLVISPKQDTEISQQWSSRNSLQSLEPTITAANNQFPLSYGQPTKEIGQNYTAYQPENIYSLPSGNQPYMPFSNTQNNPQNSSSLALPIFTFQSDQKPSKASEFKELNFSINDNNNSQSNNFLPSQDQSRYLNSNQKNFAQNVQQLSPVNNSQREEQQQSGFGQFPMESSLLISEPQEQQLINKYRHILKSLDNSQINGVAPPQIQSPKLQLQQEPPKHYLRQSALTDREQQLTVIPEYEYSDSKNNEFSRQSQLYSLEEKAQNDRQYFSAPSIQIQPQSISYPAPIYSADSPTFDLLNYQNNPFPASNSSRTDNYHPGNNNLKLHTINNQDNNSLRTNDPQSMPNTPLNNNNYVPIHPANNINNNLIDYNTKAIPSSKELLATFLTSNNNNHPQNSDRNNISAVNQTPQNNLSPLNSIIQNYKSVPSFRINTYIPPVIPVGVNNPSNAYDRQSTTQKKDIIHPQSFHSQKSFPALQDPCQWHKEADTNSQKQYLKSPLYTEQSYNGELEYKSPEMKGIKRQQLPNENGLFIPTSISPIETPERNRFIQQMNIHHGDQQINSRNNGNGIVNTIPDQMKESHRQNERSLPDRQSYFLLDGKTNPQSKHNNNLNQQQQQQQFIDNSSQSDSASRTSFSSARIKRKIFEGNEPSSSSSKAKSPFIPNLNFTKKPPQSEPSIMSIPVQSAYQSSRPSSKYYTGMEDYVINPKRLTHLPNYSQTGGFENSYSYQPSKKIPEPYPKPQQPSHSSQKIVDSFQILSPDMRSSQRSHYSNSVRTLQPFAAIEQTVCQVLCVDCEKMFDPHEIETHKCTSAHHNQRVPAGRDGKTTDQIAKQTKTGIEENSEFQVNLKLEQVFDKIKELPSCQERDNVSSIITRVLKRDIPTVQLFNESRIMTGLCKTMDISQYSHKQQYPLQVLAQRADALIKDKLEIRIKEQDQNNSLQSNSNIQGKNEQYIIQNANNPPEFRNQFFSPAHSFKSQASQEYQQQPQSEILQQPIKHNIFYSPPSRIFLPTYHAFKQNSRTQSNNQNGDNQNTSLSQQPQVMISPPARQLTDQSLYIPSQNPTDHSKSFNSSVLNRPSFLDERNTHKRLFYDIALNEKTKLQFNHPARNCLIQDIFQEAEKQGIQEKEYQQFIQRYFKDFKQ